MWKIFKKTIKDYTIEQCKIEQTVNEQYKWYKRNSTTLKENKVTKMQNERYHIELSVDKLK